jgi:hypothetical protein
MQSPASANWQSAPEKPGLILHENYDPGIITDLIIIVNTIDKLCVLAGTELGHIGYPVWDARCFWVLNQGLESERWVLHFEPWFGKDSIEFDLFAIYISKPISIPWPYLKDPKYEAGQHVFDPQWPGNLQDGIPSNIRYLRWPLRERRKSSWKTILSFPSWWLSSVFFKS